MRAPGQLVWWLCQPSLGRALLCGGGAIYLGTFVGVDAVTAFCVAQAVQLVVRALGRRRLFHAGSGAAPQLWHERVKFERLAPNRATPAVSDGRYEGAKTVPVVFSDPEPELTLDELIAGDPGPEPVDRGPELPKLAADPGRSDANDAPRLVPGLDGRIARSSYDTVPAGSDAAEALRMAVAETR